MNRQIKFRVWDYITKSYIDNGEDFYIYDCSWDGEVEYQQFTGLSDCNNKEIYEGDIIEKIGQNLADQFTYAITPKDRVWSKIGDKFVVVYLSSGFTLIPLYNYNTNYIVPNTYGNIGQYNFWNGQRHTKIIGNIFENSELLKNE